jgi:hypothetical protein
MIIFRLYSIHFIIASYVATHLIFFFGVDSIDEIPNSNITHIHSITGYDEKKSYCVVVSLEKALVISIEYACRCN